MTDFETRAKEAKQASFAMAVLPTDVKNKALLSIADALVANKDAIFSANAEDMKNAKESDLPMPLQKRLLFDEHKLNDVVSGLKSLTTLPDPVGRELMKTEMDDDLVHVSPVRSVFWASSSSPVRTHWCRSHRWH